MRHRVAALPFMLPCMLLLAQPGASAAADFWWQKVEPSVLEQAAAGPVAFLVVLDRQANLQALTVGRAKAEKTRAAVDALRGLAVDTQAPVVELARAAGAEHRAFWIVNMVRVRGDVALVERLARLDGVARVIPDGVLSRAEPIAGDLDGAGAAPPSPGPPVPPRRPARTPHAPQAPAAVEWHVSIVSAPSVWAQGVRGAGAVIGSMDTGFEWVHPALMRQYRGWLRNTTVHDYNWHDAIHLNGGSCGVNSTEPCDEDGHGTMTMGIALGDDGVGNQIGIAPEARWIGCRCYEPIRRTHLSYVSECFEWFVAPTDLGGNHADPSRAPHVIYNSWVCDPDEGCADPLVLRQIVQNVRAAGIVVVASAGNSGPFCASITAPPAIYADALTVGATNSADRMANFSSRGPVEIDASDRLKPDVVAPGQNLRTSSVGGDYTELFSGTSFSGPVVAGVIALLISAVPALEGDVERLEQIIRETADPILSTQDCGGTPATTRPNNVIGHGRVNAYAAYLRAIESQTAIEPRREPDPTTAPPPRFGFGPPRPNPFNPHVRVDFDLPEAERVDISVHDAVGRLVRHVSRGAALAAGRYAATWDGCDAAGREMPSGVYFLRLQAGPRRVDSKPVTLVR